jgi:N-acetylneuraminate synthase
LDITVPVAAVSIGACIIEKHLTRSRDEPGPDAAFSLEPGEFEAMVKAIRTAEKALGAVRYGPRQGEVPSIVFRRSLFAVEDIAKGREFTAENIRSIRPGHGLPPTAMRRVLGRRAVCDIKRGTPLSWELVEDLEKKEK